MSAIRIIPGRGAPSPHFQHPKPRKIEVKVRSRGLSDVLASWPRHDMRDAVPPCGMRRRGEAGRRTRTPSQQPFGRGGPARADRHHDLHAPRLQNHPRITFESPSTGNRHSRKSSESCGKPRTHPQERPCPMCSTPPGPRGAASPGSDPPPSPHWEPGPARTPQEAAPPRRSHPPGRRFR